MNRPVSIRFLTEVDSTSLLARREITAGNLDLAQGPVAIVAARQTGGLGRFARAWSSPVGGLWMTIAWPVEGRPDELTEGLGLRIGVAVVCFVRELVGEAEGARVRLKWPNDVLVDGKKVCGVLCELVFGPRREPWLLVGVGLNANFRIEQLPEELHGVAGTLQQLTGVTVDLSAAVRDLTDRLGSALIDRGVSPQTVAKARELLAGVGETARVSLASGEKVDAVLLGLDDNGHAIYRNSGTGEVFVAMSAVA